MQFWGDKEVPRINSQKRRDALVGDAKTNNLNLMGSGLVPIEVLSNGY